MNLNTEAATELIKEIRHLEDHNEKLRLESIPNVDLIRKVQDDIQAKRLELSRLSADAVVFHPV